MRLKSDGVSSNSGPSVRTIRDEVVVLVEVVARRDGLFGLDVLTRPDGHVT